MASNRKNLDKNGVPYVRHVTPPPHGTVSGYDYHTRDLKEDPCPPCAQALSLHWKIQRVVRRDEINELRRKKSPQNTNKRRAVKYGNGYEDFTDEQMFEMWGYNCHICEQTIDVTIPKYDENNDYNPWALHRDHVVALSRGGAHILDNVKPAHAMCNIRKSKHQWTDELKAKLADLAKN